MSENPGGSPMHAIYLEGVFERQHSASTQGRRGPSSASISALCIVSLFLLIGKSAIAGGANLSRLPAQRARAVSGNSAPLVAAPTELELVAGTSFIAASLATDPDPEDSLSGSASVSLSGLSTDVGTTQDGMLVTTVHGVVPLSTPSDRSTITWSVSDSINSPTVARTSISIVQPMSGAELESQINVFLQRGFVHGIPVGLARRLGPRAVEPLCRMLRDNAQKTRWSTIAQTLAMIGTPEVFDTLQAFMWTRFTGVIADSYTLKALIDAHGAICNIAPARPDVYDYLVRTSDPSAWKTLPWRRAKAMDSVISALSLISINGIGTIPTAEARNFLLQVKQNNPYEAGNAKEALEYQELVIRFGREGAWQEMSRRLEGGH